MSVELLIPPDSKLALCQLDSTVYVKGSAFKHDQTLDLVLSLGRSSMLTSVMNNAFILGFCFTDTACSDMTLTL